MRVAVNIQCVLQRIYSVCCSEYTHNLHDTWDCVAVRVVAVRVVAVRVVAVRDVAVRVVGVRVVAVHVAVHAAELFFFIIHTCTTPWKSRLKYQNYSKTI